MKTQLSALIFPLLLVVAFVSLSHACSPNQGFYTIVRFPEVSSKGESLYVYAIFTDEISTEEKINIDKDVNSFSSHLVEAGTVSSGENLFGCYIKINIPGSRSDQYKVGTYTATFMPNTGPIQHSIALVKSKSQILNTRGLFSLTVYPASGDRGETRLDHSTRAINLPWSPGCNKIRWIKDGRLVNTGRQLQLRKIKNAGGIYNIQQRSRGKRGIFVPFQVTVASCPVDMYFNEGSNSCVNRRRICRNGGVGRDKEDSCLCPIYLSEPSCSYGFLRGIFYQTPSFILSLALGDDLRCANLPGAADTTCKGLLFCLGDLFGCQCAPGWHGNSCDKLCPKGTWGTNCEQPCPAGCADCNPFESVASFFNGPPLECL